MPVPARPSILELVKEVLRLPTYRRLLAAYTLNQLAWAIASVSLSYVIYRRTGSAVGAAAFFLCAMFIPALLSPVAVARLDQRASRPVLSLLYAIEGLLYLALAAVTSSFSLAAVLILVLVDGTLALSARALSRAATVAVSSPAGLLREGNALMNTAFSITFMAGPALGGLVVAVSSASVALLINAGLFAVVVLTLATASGLPGAVLDRVPSVGRLRGALTHARRQPAIRRLLGMQAAGLVFFSISIPVEVVLVQRSLHDHNAGDYGALLSLWGAGAVAGSLVFARWRRLPTRVLISASAVVLAVGFAVMAIAPTLAVALIGAALGGLGNGVEAVAARTALQEHVEADWMAMIMSLNESMFQAMPGAGIVIGGAVTALTSPRVALAVAAGGALTVGAAAWALLRPPAFNDPALGAGALEQRPPAAATSHQ